MRWVVVFAVILTWTVTASAETTIPGRVFIKDSNGDVWYVGAAGNRAQVALYPASDDELAALPVLDGWFAARPNGTGVGFTVGPKPDYTVNQAATSPAREEPIKLDGERALNTRPFDLRGGNYVARWEAKLPRNGIACYSTIRLYRVVGKVQVERISSVSINRDGDRTVGGESMLYGVAAGQYYLDVSGDCSWSVELRSP